VKVFIGVCCLHVGLVVQGALLRRGCLEFKKTQRAGQAVNGLSKVGGAGCRVDDLSRAVLPRRVLTCEPNGGMNHGGGATHVCLCSSSCYGWVRSFMIGDKP
jgi:hypothetical protein